MTPKQYIEGIVLPTVREFGGDRRSRRRAYLACIVTYHIRDYLMRSGWSSEEIGGTMRVLGRNGPYDVVQAICNAAKHCGHTREHHVQFVIGSDYDRPPAIADIAVADLSIADDAIGGREIPFLGGTDIYWAVTTLLKEFQFFFPELADIYLADL